MSEPDAPAQRTTIYVVLGAFAAALMNGVASLATRHASTASQGTARVDAALPTVAIGVVDDVAPTPPAYAHTDATVGFDAAPTRGRRDARAPRRPQPATIDAAVPPPPVPVVNGQGATMPAPVAADPYTATMLLRECQVAMCTCGLVDGAALVFVFGADGKLAFVEGAVGPRLQQCVRDVVNRALRLAPSSVTRRIRFPLRCPSPRRS